MNELQTFNFEDLPVRKIEVDGEPFFVGKDVAEILGYTRPSEAIKSHVDEDDKLIRQVTVSGQKRNMVIINESGLYSLIFDYSLSTSTLDLPKLSAKSIASMYSLK
ncbi:prophage antirepressor-like protein [Staphylococcus hominis]